MTTLEEIRKKARAKMKGCYVCPDCDGNACSGMIPGYGGMRTGQSFRNNRLSFQKYGLLSHLLSASKNPDTTCSIFGKTMKQIKRSLFSLRSLNGTLVTLDGLSTLNSTASTLLSNI